MPTLPALLQNTYLQSHVFPHLTQTDLISLQQTSRTINHLISSSPITHQTFSPKHNGSVTTASAGSVTLGDSSAKIARALARDVMRRNLRILKLEGVVFDEGLVEAMRGLKLVLLSVRGYEVVRRADLVRMQEAFIVEMVKALDLGVEKFVREERARGYETDSEGEELAVRKLARPRLGVYLGESSPINFAKGDTRRFPLMHRLLSLYPPGAIQLDTPLCPTAAHSTSSPALASFNFSSSCATCHSGAREHSHYLRDPIPHTPSLHDAVRPEGLRHESYSGSKEWGVARCAECVGSACVTCKKWWCVECTNVGKGELSMGGCWECGVQCGGCRRVHTRRCEKCREEYCMAHNEGSSETRCDWCVHTSRGTTARFAGMH